MRDRSIDTGGDGVRRLSRWAACAALVLATVGFAVVATSARAEATPCDVGTATIVWDGGGGTTSWNDAANWNDVVTDQDRLPTAGDDVCVGTGGVTVVFVGGSTSVSSLEVVTGSALLVSGGSLSLDGPAPASSVATLTLSGGSLGGSGALDVATSFTWTDGDHIGSGITTVASGATFSMDTTVSNSTLGGTRQVVISPGATAQISGSGVLYGSGTIVNAGPLTLPGDPTLYATIANTGTLSTAGSGTTTLAGAFTNDGTVQVSSGTLTLGYPIGSSGGSFQVAGGATLAFAGGSPTYTSSSSFTGSGQVRLDGGDVTVTAGATFSPAALLATHGSLSLDATSSVATLTLSGGSLGGSGALDVATSFTWTDGDHIGSGITTVASGATFSMDTTVSNSTLGGTRQVVISPGATAQISGSGVLYGSGTIVNAGPLTLPGDPTLYATIANTGTLSTAGSGTTTLAGAFTNDGTVQVSSGTLTLGYPIGSSGGSFQVAGGATLAFAGGSPTYTSSSSFTGSGQVRLDGGDVTVTAGATFSPAALLATHGSLSLDATSSVATLTLSGGSLGGSGALDVATSFTWTDGDHIGSGITTVASGATFSMDTTVSNSTLGGTRQVVISPGATAQISGSGVLYGSGTIVNAGPLTLPGDPTLYATIANTGTLSTAGSGTTTLAGAFTNDGTVQVSSGTLTLGYPIGSSGGSFQVAGGATLAFAGGSPTYTSSSSFTGSGQVRLDGGDVTVTAGATFSPAALLATHGSLSLDATSSVATLTLSGGSLGGSGALDVATSFTWTDGDHIGSGITTVASGATFSMDTTVSNSTLGGTRQVVISPGATAQISGSGVLYGSGTIVNAGPLTLPGDPTLYATIANTGTLSTAGSGTTTLAGAFTNDGTVQVSSGRLDLTGPFANYEQTPDILTGGTFEIAGTLRFVGADIVSLNASIVLDGASSSVQDPSGNDGLRDLSSIGPSGNLGIVDGRSLSLADALGSAGTLSVGSGSTLSAPALTLTGGTLSGNGTVAAPVTNSGGEVRPGSSPGVLSIAGNYSQGSAGTLTVDVAGTTPGAGYDVLSVAGTANLDGTLAIATAQGFGPLAGDSFPVVTTASRTGTFATVSGLDLGGGENYRVDYGPGSVTLVAQAAPAISVSDRSVTEGDAGTTPATFDVTLSVPSSLPVTVEYATADGTAQAGSDYEAGGGILTFAPGVVSEQVTIDVIGDTVFETDETFTVGLSNPSNVGVSDGIGLGTIQNDDPPAPTVTGFKPPAQVVGKKISVLGSGFTGATGVSFTKAGGGTVTVSTFSSISDGKITLKVPPGATTGPLSVTTPCGSGMSAIDFKVKPKIKKFKPPSGPVGTLVTITGSSFTGATSVTFHGVAATSFTVVSDGKITATVPAGATSGKISVITAGGTAASKKSYTVT